MTTAAGTPPLPPPLESLMLPDSGTSELNQNRRSVSKLWQAFQLLLAVAGLAIFVLVASQADFDSVPSTAVERIPFFGGIILLLLISHYTLDTLAWWLICGENRPSFWDLTTIRLRCEAITNVVPGGALIGEPMKVAYLMRCTTMTRPEATSSFLLSKFSLIVGQTIFVLIGLILAWPYLQSSQQTLLGLENPAGAILIIASSIFLLLIGLATSMALFQPMQRILRLSERDGRIAKLWNGIARELHEIEDVIAAEVRRNRWSLILSITFSTLAWSLNGLELWVFAEWLSIDLNMPQAYSIDAVSTVVRMIFFLIPIGLGSQDAMILGLTTAYGVVNPAAAAAQLVIPKRAREFAVILLGLVMLLVMNRQRRWSRSDA